MPKTVTIYSADEVKNILIDYLVGKYGTAGWQLEFDVDSGSGPSTNRHSREWSGPRFLGMKVTKL